MYRPSRLRLRTRAIATAALALALTGTLVACGSGGPAGPAPQEEAAPGFLTVAEAGDSTGSATIQVDYDTAEANGLDPQTAQTARSWMILGLVYETLVSVDENFEIQPGLASSWEQPDELTYVFTIDTSASFSNGRGVTTEDVAESLERLTESGGVWVGQLGPIESIEATDDTTVTVKLSEPYVPFLASLANTPAAVLPIEEIDAGEVDLATEMLGTGPYTVVEHRQDESWTFAANPEWREADSLRVTDLTLQIVGQESTRQAALREGSADLVNFNNVDSLTLLSDSPAARVVNQTQTDFYYLIVNSQQPGSPLQDQDVRFAINAAVDRQAVADIVLAGESSPTGVTPSNLPGACEVDALPSRQLSAEEAGQLLADGGFDDRTLSLLLYTEEPVLAQMAQLIQQQLAEIGVTVEIEQYDTATFTSRVFTTQPGDFDLALGWFAGYGDPSMVTRWWNPEIAGFNTGFTGGHDDLNELIAQGASESDPAARAETLAELCRTADEYSEIVPLVHRPSLIGYHTETLSPTISSNEGYGDFLRYIGDFAPLGK
ncbi:ABC transporter substrate-binding protein [Leucobacter weissii]|uniref:ABC transporter substrate-binding protein n=1 Tax=Leucobacter weissii TaxID=1983706 RepID=A0A939MGT0_9MICO|nr:ABC transporter substrate-binding protein [Leucobacter weissii]MBO1900331.1 ABC transporter substrate-binding protein [Leucobacter weissii]